MDPEAFIVGHALNGSRFIVHTIRPTFAAEILDDDSAELDLMDEDGPRLHVPETGHMLVAFRWFDEDGDWFSSSSIFECEKDDLRRQIAEVLRFAFPPPPGFLPSRE